MIAKKVTVAAVQMAAKPAPIPQRLTQAEELVAAAAQAGAELVLLPELFNTGYTYSSMLHRQAGDIFGSTANWMKESARRNRVHLAGSMLLLDGDEIYNSMLLFAPDGRFWRYDKNYPWGWERVFFREGHRISIAHTELGDIGMLICWDVAHKNLWRRYAGKVDLMLVCSCPPDVSNPTFHLPDGKELTFDDMGPMAASLKNEGKNVFDQALSQQTTWLGVPSVISTCSGRIHTPLPNGRLSLLSMVVSSPFLLRHLPKANRIEMSAEIIPAGKIIDSVGNTLSSLKPENDTSFCIAQVQLSKEKKQRLESQPKNGIPWLVYLISDILLPWISVPAYRKGVRQAWGSRMAPYETTTRNWSLLLAITGLTAFIVGLILGNRDRKRKDRSM